MAYASLTVRFVPAYGAPPTKIVAAVDNVVLAWVLENRVRPK
jgi:hypothetical protein